jgi:hypothetical protein
VCSKPTCVRTFTHMYKQSTENSVFEAYVRTHIHTHVQASTDTHASTENSVFEAYMCTHVHTHVQSKHRHTRKHRRLCVRSLHAYAYLDTCTSKAQTHTQAQKTVCSKPTCVRVLCILWQSISRVWCHSPDTCPQGRLPGAPFRKCRLIHRNKGAFAGWNLSVCSHSSMCTGVTHMHTWGPGRVRSLWVSTCLIHVCTGVIHRGMPETSTSCITSHTHTHTHWTEVVFSLHVKRHAHPGSEQEHNIHACSVFHTPERTRRLVDLD